jgi:dienelactone hydrolase
MVLDQQAVSSNTELFATRDKLADISRYWVVQGLRGFVPFMLANGFGTSYPKVTNFVNAVRKDDPSMFIGAAGFCWGGRHAINLARIREGQDEPLVEVVFTGHPSGLELPGELKNINRPVSVAIGDKDFVMSLAQVDEMKQVFGTLDGVETEVRLYRGAGHGFCVRADLMDKEVEQHSIDAEDQAVAWFDRTLKRL